MNTSAILVLEDGSIFKGKAIGASGRSSGEVVFNTSMTGYQEILTDPSYAQQIVTLTYPHIGNTGVNSEDNESEQVWATGLVIRDLPLLASNWRHETSLQDFLLERGVVAIADIDTRRLTRILREKGAQNGCIIAGEELNKINELEEVKDEKTLIAAALKDVQAFPGLKGLDLAKVVTTKKQYTWDSASWSLEGGYQSAPEECPYHVVAYDFGVKQNILRLLVDRGCRLTVVSATTSADEVLALKPDGVFLSNGPGDPDPCDYAIIAIKSLLEADIPIFGICLGHQLLALASGARTIKMKFGHHGANHPVQNLEDGTVLITSQNHGFAVDELSMPECLEVSHKSLFDDSLQGIHHKSRPAFGFQGHPEASPGPQDAQPLFDHFIELMTDKQA